MKKPFIVANVREITDAWDREEISYSRMVEMLNEIAEKFYTELRLSKIILETKREVIVAYYTKISMNNLTADQILNAIEVDMEFLKQEIALVEAKELLNQVTWK